MQIFRAGTHTDSRGRTLTFSAADIAATAAAYAPDVHEAPLVVGHPAMDDPAYGWVESLAATVDGVLEATPHQVDPAFAALVAEGRFKRVSASFYAPDAATNPAPGVWCLRHVGFLGAHPPAVKGLRPVMFAAAGADAGLVTIEFSAELSAEFSAPTTREDTATSGDMIGNCPQYIACSELAEIEFMSPEICPGSCLHDLDLVGYSVSRMRSLVPTPDRLAQAREIRIMSR